MMAAVAACMVCAAAAKDRIVVVQKALFLAGLSPELYFIEQEYQAKRFVPDQFVDITDVMKRKCELIRMYKCQYRDG